MSVRIIGVLRKIRRCESEAAAQVVLEGLIAEVVAKETRTDDDGLAVKIGKVLEETKTQSLNHIRAQAIEEYQKAIKIGVYFIDSNILDIGDDLISKYKEQSDD